MYLSTVLLSLVFIIVGNQVASRNRVVFAGYESDLLVEAKVQAVYPSQSSDLRFGDTVLTSTLTTFDALLLRGENKGIALTGIHVDDPTNPYRLRPVKTGDKVFLKYAPEAGYDARWILQDYIRTDGLIVLALCIAAGLLLFGRGKGVHTIISLTFTCLSIFTVFIPSILAGMNIYLSSLVVSVFIVMMTNLLVNGFNRKSFCSIIGCICGLGMSGILTLFMDRALGLTGLIDEDAVLLLYLNGDNPINLRAIIFAAILIGALGAIMDVAISIASALHEVHLASPGQDMSALMKSGLTIGRDIVGTMSNTLLLAYIGGSLSLVVLLVAYNNSLIALLNKELIVVEILQSLVGIAGLLFVIPLTSLVSAYIFTRKRTGNEG